MTTRPDPIGFARLVSPEVVRVFARVESEEIPGLVGDYQEDLPIELLESRGFRLLQMPEGEASVPVYAVSTAGR